MIHIICTKNESNLTNRYWDMVPDRQKVRTDGRTDGMDGRTHGRRQNYIPPTSSGDNKGWSASWFGNSNPWIDRNQPMSCSTRVGCCTIHLQYESKLFLSVAEFRCLYRVTLDRSKTLFYCWKNVLWSFLIMKKTQIKLNRKDTGFVDISVIFKP